MSSPLAAVWAAIETVAAERPGLVVVVGSHRLLLPATVAPLVVAGPTARLAAGDGLALAGRQVLTVGDDLPDASWLVRPQVLLVGPDGRRTGLPVISPVWSEDVVPLLRAAVAAARPVELRLHDEPVDGARQAAHEAHGLPGDAIDLEAARLFRPGAELLLAAGAMVPLALAVAARAAARGVDLGAVELPVLPPGVAADLDGAVGLVAADDAAAVPRAGRPASRVRRVPVPRRDPSSVLDAVLARLSQPS